MLDENDVVIDSIIGSNPINAGIYNSTDFSTAETIGGSNFELSQSQIDNLTLAKRLIINIDFNSYQGGNVKIAPDAYFNFRLHSDLNIRIAF